MSFQYELSQLSLKKISKRVNGNLFLGSNSIVSFSHQIMQLAKKKHNALFFFNPKKCELTILRHLGLLLKYSNFDHDFFEGDTESPVS